MGNTIMEEAKVAIEKNCQGVVLSAPEKINQVEVLKGTLESRQALIKFQMAWSQGVPELLPTLVFRFTFPNKFPKIAYTEVIREITSDNDGIRVGCFHLDERDGEVTFEVSTFMAKDSPKNIQYREKIFQSNFDLGAQAILQKHEKYFNLWMKSQNISEGGIREISFSEVEIGKRLGGGGMGEVFVGKWSGVEVAVKKFKIEQTGISCVKKEIEITAKLRHPNLILLFSTCRDPFCLIMPYYKKGNLEEKMMKEGPLKVPVITEIFQGIVCGMKYLNDMDIIHGDLKPQNILMSDADQPIICDLGLSKFRKPEENPQAKNSTDNTMFGSVIGFTELYAAPEVVKKSKISRRSDVFSFGMMLFHFLCPEINLVAFRNEYPLPKIPSKQHLLDVVERTTKENPDARPQFGELFVLFEGFKNSPVPEPSPTPTPAPASPLTAPLPTDLQNPLPAVLQPTPAPAPAPAPAPTPSPSGLPPRSPSESQQTTGDSWQLFRDFLRDQMDYEDSDTEDLIGRLRAGGFKSLKMLANIYLNNQRDPEKVLANVQVNPTELYAIATFMQLESVTQMAVTKKISQ